MASSLEVVPAGAVQAEVTVPGSKSITNRALICAVLAEGVTLLRNASASDDTRVLIAALKALGFEVTPKEDRAEILVYGRSGEIPVKSSRFDLGNAGTSLRFLASLACLGRGLYVVDGSTRMRERPIGGLVEALRWLGAKISYMSAEGFPPIEIQAGGLRGGHTMAQGDVSSQFVSSILLSAPYAMEPVEVEVESDLVSRAYVDMTIQVMAEFGVPVKSASPSVFAVPAGRYKSCDFVVEGDAASAGYFFGLAAVTGGTARVNGLGSATTQPEMMILGTLERMGCRLSQTRDATEVRGSRLGLKGVDIDMQDHPDSVPMVAAIALFANGPTRIRRVRHLRYKETDRLSALAAELRKLGAEVTEHPDGLGITPPKSVRRTSLKTYGDHRLAMSFAIAGAQAAGLVIEDPDCVSKSFPGFWEALATTGVGVRKIN